MLNIRGSAMTSTLTHIALHVEDSEKCALFYSDYCGMHECRRHGSKENPVIWMASEGQDKHFVIVLIAGGPPTPSIGSGFSHLGFALPTNTDVDKIAGRAKKEGCLLWEPRQDPWPASYYCGVVDPGGNQVEFSCGQPLGADTPIRPDWEI